MLIMFRCCTAQQPHFCRSFFIGRVKYLTIISVSQLSCPLIYILSPLRSIGIFPIFEDMVIPHFSSKLKLIKTVKQWQFINLSHEDIKVIKQGIQ